MPVRTKKSAMSGSELWKGMSSALLAATLLEPEMENLLEWVLFVALVCSGVCILSLGMMNLVAVYRMYRKFH